jgi:hypothetical protein
MPAPARSPEARTRSRASRSRRGIWRVSGMVAQCLRGISASIASTIGRAGLKMLA